MAENYTVYDNKDTYKYKKAFQDETIEKFVFTRDPEGDEPIYFEKVYDSVSKYIDRMLLTKDILEICEDLKILTKNYFYVNRYMPLLYFVNIVSNSGINEFPSFTTAEPFLEDIKRKFERYVSNIINDIYTMIKALNEELRKQKEQDDKVYGSIVEIHGYFIQVNEDNKQESIINFSEVTYDSSEKTFNPLLNDLVPTIEDGYAIFDQIIVNKYIPYVRYIDNFGNIYYKIFTGEQLDIRTVSEENLKLTKINSIYLSMWVGDSSKHNLIDATFEDIQIMTYSLVKNRFKVSGKTKERTNKTNLASAIEILKKSCPELLFGDGKETRVDGEFNINGFVINEIAFLDQILLNKYISPFLYIEEKDNSYAAKVQSNFSIRYKPLLTDLDFVEDEEDVRVNYFNNYAPIKLTIRHIHVTKNERDKENICNVLTIANSREEVNSFLIIFKLLLAIYHSRVDDVIKEYSYYKIEEAVILGTLSRTNLIKEKLNLNLMLQNFLI
jgi:hypothetical protein